MKKILIYTLLLFFISLKLYAEYNQLPGFPYSSVQDGTFGSMRGVGVVNINDDPFLEIVVSTFDTTFAINYQGERLWTAYTPHEAQNTMSFADMDNDGYLEILQTTRSGWLYILDKDGNNFPGWPKYFGTPAPYLNYVITTPVAYDLDDNGQKEIIWGDFDTCGYQNYLYVVDINGDNFNDNFPFPVPNGVSGTPAIGDVDNDGIPEIICMDIYELYILKPDGSILDGWPQQPFDGNAKYWNTSPVIADLTGDGFLEIITAALGPIPPGTPSGLIVYTYYGTILDGWPQDFPYITKCTPSVADLDNDGTLEIICGRGDVYSLGNLLYIFDINGENFLNAPYYSHGNVMGPIIIGNIDDSSEKEIIFDSNRATAYPHIGYIQGIHCNGDTIIDFPLRPKGCTLSNSSVFGDINQDGVLDLITFSDDIIHDESLWIYVYNLDHLYNPLEIEWKTYQYDFQRLGQYHPPYSFDPPINLTAHTDEHGVYLLWQPPENRRNYAYNIFRDDDFLKRNADTTYIDTDVQSYTTYYYYVTSVYEQGYSPPSEVIEVTTDSIMSVDNLPYSDTSKICLNCFPNPFTTSTTISFNLATRLRSASPGQAEIKIYNVKGQLVRKLSIVNSQSSIEWDGKDENGKEVPNGIYFYRLSSGDKSAIKKMLLLK